MSWLERTEMLVGEDGIARLSSARVAVIGVGGVGGYAAEMIVRAGVGHILILDSDEVSVSNRNRQLLALNSTVGRPKCQVLKERLLDINPDLDIVTVEKFIIAEGAVPDSGFEDASGTPSQLLGAYEFDYVVDAIDTLSPKLELIKYCMDRKIPLVSSMGAGAKFDVTRIRITDISKSFQCPLAHMVRKRLGKMGIRKGFKAVFSEEIADRSSIVLEAGRNKKSQVGTISYLPASFGCACAQAVITGLLGV
ncbi:MAG: tRNA threonylcarbamoyladenosine dehydratase [Candidatus Cryptobacteroides sp.]|nr:tRNA threonylcarbamoyladenosine dehydratase [Bacteroidales bacterium]MDD7154092.1 tRNA threonylcarbamoyladenosine dehydratase [Bacteroidales bacterium]MDY5263302.1 tRNA threonylcarbamoyladenosine dehydratase [Candidatus Cryptobacteroides sp.]MDY5496201.1 tRNA threonylcarbamoyladenosine dehydratase [Candidatus Cryptobacteroides sp.]